MFFADIFGQKSRIYVSVTHLISSISKELNIDAGAGVEIRNVNSTFLAKKA